MAELPAEIPSHPDSQATAILTAMDLDSRIQALPQELQDEIFQLALIAALPSQHGTDLMGNTRYQRMQLQSTASKSARPTLYRWIQSWRSDRQTGRAVTVNIGDIRATRFVLIDQNYRPSMALQINRKTRDIMSKILYNNTVFLRPLQSRLYADRVGRNWLRSISQQHREMAEILVLLGLRVSLY